jgi:Tetratricopeptide repeat
MTGTRSVALLYRNQGRYADAEPLYQRSLAIREKALGLEHPDIATSLSDLASGALFRRHQPGVVVKRLKFPTEMMRADAGFHPDQARLHIGEARFHLAGRPFLPQHDAPASILADAARATARRLPPSIVHRGSSP